MVGDWQLVEKQLEVDGCQLVPPIFAVIRVSSPAIR